MQLTDEIALCRILLAEQTQNRWTDSDLTNLINRGRQQIAFDVQWPEITFTTSTTPLVSGYPLPEQQKILRVYLGGQLIVPTSLPDQDGSILQIWDESGTNNAPAWNVEPSSAYPQTATYAGQQATAQTWTPMGRAVFYLRGGNIFFIPMPSSVATIQIDAVPIPNVLVNPGDYDIFPDNFRDAICWYAVGYALFADKDPMATQALQMYETCSRKLQAWKNEMLAFRPRTPVIVTYRTLFSDPSTADQGRGPY
jgi:hypothetical protein